MSETKVRGVMRRFAERRITRAEAAEELDIAVRTFNRWAKKRGVERVRSDFSKAEAARAQRRQTKMDVAHTVIKGHNTVENAAKVAGVSVKTIERWVEKLENDQKSVKNHQNHTKNAGKHRKTSGNR